MFPLYVMFLVLHNFHNFLFRREGIKHQRSLLSHSQRTLTEEKVLQKMQLTCNCSRPHQMQLLMLVEKHKVQLVTICFNEKKLDFSQLRSSFVYFDHSVIVQFRSLQRILSMFYSCMFSALFTISKSQKIVMVFKFFDFLS